MSGLPDTAEYWNDIKSGFRNGRVVGGRRREPRLHSTKFPCEWAAQQISEGRRLQEFARTRRKKVTCKACLDNWPEGVE